VSQTLQLNAANLASFLTLNYSRECPTHLGAGILTSAQIGSYIKALLSGLNDLAVQQRNAVDSSRKTGSLSTHLVLELVTTLKQRYLLLLCTRDMKESIALCHEALENIEQGDSYSHIHTSALCLELATALRHLAIEDETKFAGLQEGVDACRRALRLLHKSEPLYARVLCELGDSLREWFLVSSEDASLAEALAIHLSLSHDHMAHPTRHRFLCSYGKTVYYHFRQSGNASLIAESVGLVARAVSLCPVDHPDYFTTLLTYSWVLHYESRAFTDIGTVLRSISVCEEILDVCIAASVEWSTNTLEYRISDLCRIAYGHQSSGELLMKAKEYAGRALIASKGSIRAL
jgi:hypothetical protein